MNQKTKINSSKFKLILLAGLLMPFAIFAQSKEGIESEVYISTGKLDGNSSAQSNALQMINSTYAGNLAVSSIGLYRWYDNSIAFGLDSKMSGSVSKVGVRKQRTLSYSDDTYLEIGSMSSNPNQFTSGAGAFVLTQGNATVVGVTNTQILSPFSANQNMTNVGYKGRFTPFGGQQWLEKLGFNLGTELNSTIFKGTNNLSLGNSTGTVSLVGGQTPLTFGSSGAGIESREINHNERALLAIFGISYVYDVGQSGQLLFSYDFIRTVAPLSGAFRDEALDLATVARSSYSGSTKTSIEGNRFVLGYSHKVYENFRVGIRYGLESTKRTVESADIKFSPGIPVSLLSGNFLFDLIGRNQNIAYGPFPSSTDTRNSLIIEAVLEY